MSNNKKGKKKNTVRGLEAMRTVQNVRDQDGSQFWKLGHILSRDVVLELHADLFISFFLFFFRSQLVIATAVGASYCVPDSVQVSGGAVHARKKFTER